MHSFKIIGPVEENKGSINTVNLALIIISVFALANYNETFFYCEIIFLLYSIFKNIIKKLIKKLIKRWKNLKVNKKSTRNKSKNSLL